MTDEPNIHPAILEAEQKLKALENRIDETIALRTPCEDLLAELEALLASLTNFTDRPLSGEELQRTNHCVDHLADVIDYLANRDKPPKRPTTSADLREAVNTMGNGAKSFHELEKMLTNLVNSIPEHRKALQAAAQLFAETEQWQQIRALFDVNKNISDEEAVKEFLREATIFDFDSFVLRYDIFLPLIAEITGEMRAAGRDSISLQEFFGHTNRCTGKPVVSIYQQCITRAYKENTAKDMLERVATKKVEMLEYPIDKVNMKVWDLLEEDTAGQLAIAMEKVGSKREVNVLYSIDFDNLGAGVKITKRLDSFDKRAYIAIGALWNAGNTVLSSNQIHTAMGNSGKPSANQIQRINDALTKMASARIYVDNTQEAAEYKYDRFVYDGQLLPMERMAAVKQGQITEMAVKLFREPPLISFAKQRKQITTLPLKLLQSPVSKTEGNLMIDDYLLERISRARKDGKKKQQRILYETLFNRADITTPMQKARAPKTIARYLEHYKKCGFIQDFTEETDGVTVYF